jgi:ADP-heptose:LPS heptosyltransferase
MSGWLEARNILAVRLDNLGDVIMLGPALRAIKTTSPATRLTLLASLGGAAAAALLPWVDDVIGWPALWQDLGRLPFDPTREQALIARLADLRFDAALIFTSFGQTPHVAGYVCYLAGIPLRAGESKEFGGSCLTTALASAPDEIHQVDRNLALVEQLGFAAHDRRLAVAIPGPARTAAAKLLRGAGVDPEQPFILLHPGASAQARRYPPERFGAVARLLAESGRQVLITGVEREAALLERIRAEAPQASYLTGQTALTEYAALIERAGLVICNNTLPMHLADALERPLVCLFAGTELESQWQPRFTLSRLLRQPTTCQPCYLFECPIGQPCLDISPEEVTQAAELVMQQASLDIESRVILVHEPWN